jgi:alpha-ketoglutarate-dependent 2,4-dichlorophenoxyacetate dioxygenase
MDDATFAEIRAAFEAHSVLVFHDQSLDDECQIAFSRRSGVLETSGKANPATAALISRDNQTSISRPARSSRPRTAA